jgi:hypothetical protein
MRPRRTLAMPFIRPMLAMRLEDPRKLADRVSLPSPTLDGQRAQVHLRRGERVPISRLLRPACVVLSGPLDGDYLVTVLASASSCGAARLAVRSAISQAAATPERGSLLPGIVEKPAFSIISRCVYEEVSALSRASCLEASGCFM